ncbi:MAG: zinc-dependent alcohol dehydrogenase [Ilumatobacteraceae bacterium]
MRAVYPAGKSVALRDAPAPGGPGVDLRVAMCGICGSDLHMLENGMRDVIVGHEFGGWLADGRLVAVRPTGECGSCTHCARGRHHLCADALARSYGISMDGGLTEMAKVEESRITPMPEGSRPRDAAIVEPLAVAMHGARRAGVTAGGRALVVGAGSIGLLTVAVLRAWGVDCDIVARHPHQRLAAEALGAGVVERPSGSTYSVVFDAVCSQETVDLSIDAAEPGGTLLEFGLFWAPVRMSNAMLLKEITFVPAMFYGHDHSHNDFAESAALAGTNPGIADALVTHEFALVEAREAFRVASDRASGAIKVHLHP